MLKLYFQFISNIYCQHKWSSSENFPPSCFLVFCVLFCGPLFVFSSFFCWSSYHLLGVSILHLFTIFLLAIGTLGHCCFPFYYLDFGFWLHLWYCIELCISMTDMLYILATPNTFLLNSILIFSSLMCFIFTHYCVYQFI